MIEGRNSDGRFGMSEPSKEVSLREALLFHAEKRPGGITDQDRIEIDQIAPEPAVPEPSRFGVVGEAYGIKIRTERRSGDPLEIKDHADWLARKAEILKEAFPDNRGFRNY